MFTKYYFCYVYHADIHTVRVYVYIIDIYINTKYDSILTERPS